MTAEDRREALQQFLADLQDGYSVQQTLARGRRKLTDRVGQQLGNYRLLRLLGTGGFAEVYLGEQVHLGTHAAIKVLTARLSTEEMAQFREEARTIARLNHPHIVRLLDFGLAEGTPYLVMEYAAHGTLRQRHPRSEPLPPGVVLPYVQQIASALQYAHERKLIHRDIKPENMLIGESGTLLLSDFGIALVAQSSRYQSTQDTAGTLAYMAPEQIQGHPRPASDQYALGVVVYEWLTGARPFTGSMGEIIAQHLSQPPRSLREKVPGLSATLDEVVLTALAKDPKERFQTLQAFATALEQASQATFVLERGPSSSPSLLPPTLLPPTLPAPPPVTILEMGEQAAGAPTLAARGLGSAAPGARPEGVTAQGAPGPERAPVRVMVPVKNKASRRKKALMVALVLVLLAATGGLIGALVWNSGPKFNAAYQSIVQRKPDVEYTMRDSFSQAAWGNQQGCAFVAQGYLETGDTVICVGSNGLPNYRTTNLLVQVTMSIQRGTCGALAVDKVFVEADLCADGTTNKCSFSSGGAFCTDRISTNAIHQGLGKENTLALEVVAGQNNQLQLIIFINGQYVVEETAAQDQREANSIFLSAGDSTTADSSILFTDVQVWQVSNPVS